MLLSRSPRHSRKSIVQLAWLNRTPIAVASARIKRISPQKKRKTLPTKRKKNHIILQLEKVHYTLKRNLTREISIIAHRDIRQKKTTKYHHNKSTKPTSNPNNSLFARVQALIYKKTTIHQSIQAWLFSHPNKPTNHSTHNTPNPHNHKQNRKNYKKNHKKKNKNQVQRV